MPSSKALFTVLLDLWYDALYKKTTTGPQLLSLIDSRNLTMNSFERFSSVNIQSSIPLLLEIAMTKFSLLAFRDLSVIVMGASR